MTEISAEIMGDLRRLRAANADARAALAALDDAPPVDAEVAVTVDRIVAELAAQARLSVGFDLPGAPDGADRVEETAEALSGLPAAVLMAIVDPKSLRRGLLAEALSARSGTPLSAADKRADGDRLGRELGELERAEEAVIRRAEAAGLAVLRRGDADPAAVLAPEIGGNADD